MVFSLQVYLADLRQKFPGCLAVLLLLALESWYPMRKHGIIRLKQTEVPWWYMITGYWSTSYEWYSWYLWFREMKEEINWTEHINCTQCIPDWTLIATSSTFRPAKMSQCIACWRGPCQKLLTKRKSDKNQGADSQHELLPLYTQKLELWYKKGSWVLI